MCHDEANIDFESLYLLAGFHLAFKKKSLQGARAQLQEVHFKWY